MSDVSEKTELQLRQIADGLWVIDHPFKVMGACIGTRTTIVRLDDGGLWLLSPGAGLARLKSEIEALGPVTALVAPNNMHHLALPATSSLFPTARVYGPAGLVAKQPGLKFTPFDELGPDHWPGLQMLSLKGFGPLEERAFYHRATRTLMVTDLVFNIQHSAHTWTRLFMRLNDGYGKFGPTRICRALIKDKTLLAQTLDHLLRWDFERVIMAHGDVQTSGGKQALQAAFSRIGIQASGRDQAAVLK